MKVKLRAIRSGTWFKILSRTERAILDLTIRCVKRVRSWILAETITKIIIKLLKTLKEDFMSQAQRVGRKIAEKLSEIAKRWGNKTCYSWSSDNGFVIYLGINALNIKISI
jgi:hypothetical protein